MKQRGFADSALFALAAIGIAAGVIWLQDREIGKLKLQHATTLQGIAEKTADTYKAIARYERAVGDFNAATSTAIAAQEREADEALQTVRRRADVERAGRLRADTRYLDATARIKDMARRASTDAEREASAAAIGMLADMLGRADARAGILATTADESRARGIACERQYNTVANRINAGPPKD